MTAATVATSASNTIDALEPFSKALENISTVVAGLLPSAIGLSRAFAGVGQAFTTVSSNFTGSVGNIGNALSGLGNAFVKVLPGNINGASAAAAAGLGGVASAIGSLGTAIPGVLGGMLGLGQALVGFVQVANPGVVQLFTKAFGDLEAVIGQALTPVLQIVTQVIRMGADALASFLPQLGSVIGAMLSSFMPVVKILLDALAMIGQGILLVFQAAQPLIEAFGMIYSAIYEAFMPVVKLMIELVSGALSQALKAISSVMTQILPYILAFTMYLKTLMEQLCRLDTRSARVDWSYVAGFCQAGERQIGRCRSQGNQSWKRGKRDPDRDEECLRIRSRGPSQEDGDWCERTEGASRKNL